MKIRKLLEGRLCCLSRLIVASFFLPGLGHLARAANTALAPAAPSVEIAVGHATAASDGNRITLGNDSLLATWQLADDRLVLTRLKDLVNNQSITAEMPAFTLELGDGSVVSAASLTPAGTFSVTDLTADPKSSVLAERFPGKAVEVRYDLTEKKIGLVWRAILRDGSSYIRQEIVLTPQVAGIVIRKLTMISLELPDAKVCGSVRGSPITAGNLFLGIEHPVALSQIVTKDGQPLGVGAARAECSFSRGVPLPAGKPWSLSSVIGVSPPGQMRRAFNAYLDRERAHSYRQFPHYNSWYDLNIDRPGRMTEAEMLKSLNVIGNELTTKRGVKLASFVMDDGWDSRNTVWNFNDGFPQGFTNVAKAAARYDAGIGLWMSPWGGYGGRDQRIAAGRPFGYETNGNGFSMAGPKYRAHFLETGLRMIHDYHANFFKFDGMGGGAMSDGGDNAYANDMDAIIGVCGELRKAEPDLFISATVGTWPSPFWLRSVDSIWRQGEDVGMAGVGNGRERWITYRDATVYSRIVQRGPLYPIQSLMVHGIVIGERGIPAQMDRTEESVRHEARSFFGTGTDLQELYLTPHLLTPGMWDSIAESAKWAQRHADCLVDSHWVGGNPGALQIYGFAGWIPGKGVLTLRNPSDKPQVFSLDIGAAFELPPGNAKDVYVLISPWPDQAIQSLTAVAGHAQTITLPPFAVFTFDAMRKQGGVPPQKAS